MSICTIELWKVNRKPDADRFGHVGWITSAGILTIAPLPIAARVSGRGYCVAETISGSAVLLQPFISILPSGRTVPVIMPVVLKGVATLPW